MVDEVKVFPELISEVLGRGHDVRFRAPGLSMHPTIRENEAITVRPVSVSAIRKGDIILYCWRQGVIAHRIVGIDKAGGGAIRFIMRGDASGASTEQIKPEQILGKVVAIKRGRRRINPYGLSYKIERALRPWASRLKGRLFRYRIQRS